MNNEATIYSYVTVHEPQCVKNKSTTLVICAQFSPCKLGSNM